MAKDPNYEVHEILLGKEQPKAKTRYVKQAKNPQVFSVPTRSLKNLEKKVLDFKDKTVIRIDAKKLTRIEVQHPKGKTVLVRKEEAPKKDAKKDAKKDKKKADKKAKPKMVWTVEEPKVLKLDTAGVDRVARMLEKRFRARSYAETTEPEKTGLDKPEGRVLLTVEGERRPVELLVGKEKDKRKRFLQVKGKPEVYLMGPHPLGQIYKEPEKWKKRKRPQGMGRGGRRRMPPGMMRRMRRRRR